MSTSSSLCDDCGRAPETLHTIFSPPPNTDHKSHLYSAAASAATATAPVSSLHRQANHHQQQPNHHHHHLNQQHHHHHHQQQQQQQQQQVTTNSQLHPPQHPHLHNQTSHFTNNINNNTTNKLPHNNNNHHHHYHHQSAALDNRQQQHNMAAQHYKFHNDCQSSVLTYEQVKRLDFVMDQTVPIHGRGNFPTLYVKLKELIRLVKFKLQKEHSIEIRDVRLNGGAASYVLAPENSHYNDLDLIFATDLSHQDRFDVIRDVVLECLKEFFPNKEDLHQHHNCQQSFQMPLSSNCSIKEAYVHKMVKVNDDDRWSLISLGVQQSESNSCGQADKSLLSQQQQQQQQEHTCDSLNVSSPDKHSQVQHEHSNNCSENDSSSTQSPRHNCLSTASARITVNTSEVQKSSTINLTNCEQQNDQHHQHQQIYPQQLQQFQNQRNHYQHQKQFPNSIELKFVDRMRRKFEFSVDSFQIILDSLIQFYDYAPQSTIASQRKLISSHPSSTMVNTRPLISKQRFTDRYPFGGDQAIITSDYENTTANMERKLSSPNSLNIDYCENNQLCKTTYNSQNLQARDNAPSDSKQCDSMLNSFQSYYQLPNGEPPTTSSPSISSVASSSGCSSSSSIVSSSSLSCDEDHEDLYCDTDSPSSSSASTSSLLSSTNSSLLSSADAACSAVDLESHHQLKHHQAVISDNQKLQTSDTSQSNELSKLQQQYQERMNQDKSNVNLDSAVSSKMLAAVKPLEIDNILHEDCFMCNRSQQQQQQTQHTFNDCRLYDFESSYQTSTCAVISENFYPTVIGRSEYGDFKEAFYHLEKKLIATRSPEEIRGGGLLKYCNLLVKNYKPTNVYQIRTLERYMCSRFFIDFSDLSQQQAKLESYLANHFSDDPILKFDYLTILHNVVHRSTVCLMNHELRLTLNMIRDLAYRQNGQQQQQQQQQRQQQQSQQVSQLNQSQAQMQHHYYQQQKPVLFQSGVYRVKLVNYTLAKPVRPQ